MSKVTNDKDIQLNLLKLKKTINILYSITCLLCTLYCKYRYKGNIAYRKEYLEKIKAFVKIIVFWLRSKFNIKYRVRIDKNQPKNCISL